MGISFQQITFNMDALCEILLIVNKQHGIMPRVCHVSNDDEQRVKATRVASLYDLGTKQHFLLLQSYTNPFNKVRVPVTHQIELKANE